MLKNDYKELYDILQEEGTSCAFCIYATHLLPKPYCTLHKIELDGFGNTCHQFYLGYQD